MGSHAVVNVVAHTRKSSAVAFARMSEALGVLMMKSYIVDPFRPVEGSFPMPGKISYGTSTVPLLYLN
jgi:hypothetical protein